MPTNKEASVEVAIAFTVDAITGETTETIMTAAELLETQALFAEMHLQETLSTKK